MSEELFGLIKELKNNNRLTSFTEEATYSKFYKKPSFYFIKSYQI